MSFQAWDVDWDWRLYVYMFVIYVHERLGNEIHICIFIIANPSTFTISEDFFLALNQYRYTNQYKIIESYLKGSSNVNVLILLTVGIVWYFNLEYMWTRMNIHVVRDFRLYMDFDILWYPVWTRHHILVHIQTEFLS